MFQVGKNMLSLEHTPKFKTMVKNNSDFLGLDFERNREMLVKTHRTFGS